MSASALNFLLSLRPALPMSKERPCTPASNSEVRRWLREGAVLINGERASVDTPVDRVDSLVLFPASARSRCTLF